MMVIRVLAAAMLALILAVGTAQAGSAQTGPAPETGAAPSGPAAATPDAPDILAGTYRVQGTGPDGNRYVGQATLTRQGDLYLVTWQVEDDVYQGTGLVQGNAFGVVWTPEDGSSPGIALYTVAPGGELSGIWATHGQPGVGTETWTPARG